jgi:hypothetical protein
MDNIVDVDLQEIMEILDTSEPLKSENDIRGVYFIIENPFREKVKIGKTKNIKRRLDGLQTAHPDELVLYKFIQTEKHHELEQELHKQFKSKRIRGEWFELTLTEIDKVTNRRHDEGWNAIVKKGVCVDSRLRKIPLHDLHITEDNRFILHYTVESNNCPETDYKIGTRDDILRYMTYIYSNKFHECITLIYNELENATDNDTEIRRKATDILNYTVNLVD